MRLWSFRPKYLNGQYLGAVWHEGISKAQTGLQGGRYENHSQLQRFKSTDIAPMMLLAQYLHHIWWESFGRGYNYDSSKIIGPLPVKVIKLLVTDKQLTYEWQHYLNKIKDKDPEWHDKLRGIKLPDPHPMFYMVQGEIEDWERVKE
jgi:hypothetical protein